MQFTLPFPPSVNARYKMQRGRRSKGDKVIAWIDAATSKLNEDCIPPFEGRCSLIYELYHPDERIRDDSNYAKYLTDLLVQHGILKDDCRRYVKSTTTIWADKPGGYVVIKIIPVD